MTYQARIELDLLSARASADKQIRPALIPRHGPPLPARGRPRARSASTSRSPRGRARRTLATATLTVSLGTTGAARTRCSRASAWSTISIKTRPRTASRKARSCLDRADDEGAIVASPVEMAMPPDLVRLGGAHPRGPSHRPLSGSRGPEVLDGATADRRFAWGPRSRSDRRDDGRCDLVEWTIVAVCRLNNIGRTRRERSGATSAEAQSLISTAINRTVVWPTGSRMCSKARRRSSILTVDRARLTLPRVLSVETTAYAYGPVVEIDPQGESEIVYQADPDLVVGDGEVEIGAVALTVGTYEWSQAVWSDTATADAPPVTVRLRDEGGPRSRRSQRARPSRQRSSKTSRSRTSESTH